MDRNELREKIVKAIAEVACPAVDTEIKDADKFDDDLGLDSLDVIEILLWIESELDVEVPDVDLHMIDTVGQLVDYVEKLVNEPA